MNKLTKFLAAILIATYGVWALDNVSYIDANGVTQTANNVTVINSSVTTLNAGWYIMQGTFTNGLSGIIYISGTVHLILADNSNVTV